MEAEINRRELRKLLKLPFGGLHPGPKEFPNEDLASNPPTPASGVEAKAKKKETAACKVG